MELIFCGWKAWQKIAGMEGGKVAINKILTLINSKN